MITIRSSYDASSTIFSQNPLSLHSHTYYYICGSNLIQHILLDVIECKGLVGWFVFTKTACFVYNYCYIKVSSCFSKDFWFGTHVFTTISMKILCESILCFDLDNSKDISTHPKHLVLLAHSELNVNCVSFTLWNMQFSPNRLRYRCGINSFMTTAHQPCH